jgi:alkylated DNA nucleotide flippase Atl1
MTNSTGIVSQLFCKLAKGAMAIQPQQITLRANWGIEQDVHAHQLSPRQVLVVRAEDLRELSIDPGKLSENIVIKGIQTHQFLPGAMLKFAGGAAVRLTFYCEPCKRIGHLVDSLQTINKKRGILGTVINGGLLSVTEEFIIQPKAFPALSEIPYERFLEFLLKIPQGKVVTYQTVIIGIGVDRGYFRAIPGYLQKAAAAGYPAYKVLDSKGYLTPHLLAQGDQLINEGIELNQASTGLFVSLPKYLW